MKKEKQQILTTDPVVTQRNYKGTLFCTIFREPTALLSLYNAVNNTEYIDPSAYLLTSASGTEF